MNLHLTHEQLCDVLLADSSLPSAVADHETDVVDQHLQACLICAAELKSLRDSLSHSYARRSSIAPPHSVLSQPLYWAAAAVVFVAALFPISLHQQQSAARSAAKAAAAVSAQTAESDEALLSDIDQKVSADVPSPMEPLADPTDSTTSLTSTSDQRTN
jgi:phage terminase large subunit GpA-like protein